MGETCVLFGGCCALATRRRPKRQDMVRTLCRWPGPKRDRCAAKDR